MLVDFAVEILLPFAPGIEWSPGLSDKVEFEDFNLTEREFPMTDDRLPLAELAAKSGDADFLRVIAENVLQLIMEADVDGLIGAGRYERGETRQTWRNGYRERALDTRLGTLNLKIPKMRSGAYFPGFLEPLHRSPDWSRPARGQRRVAAPAPIHAGRGHGRPEPTSDRGGKAASDYTEGRLIMTARDHTQNYTTLTDATRLHRWLSSPPTA